eukprot:3356999-Rhodomonas_salina.1
MHVVCVQGFWPSGRRAVFASHLPRKCAYNPLFVPPTQRQSCALRTTLSTSTLVRRPVCNIITIMRRVWARPIPVPGKINSKGVSTRIRTHANSPMIRNRDSPAPRGTAGVVVLSNAIHHALRLQHALAILYSVQPESEAVGPRLQLRSFAVFALLCAAAFAHTYHQLSN